MVERLFLAVPWGCLQFVIFPDHTHYFCVCLSCFQTAKAPFVLSNVVAYNKLYHLYIKLYNLALLEYYRPLATNGLMTLLAYTIG